MRLLNTEIVEVIEVYGSDIPRYAILSHTWSDGEILIQELEDPRLRDAAWKDLTRKLPKGMRENKRRAFDKLVKSTMIARQRGYDHIWVDTCCIDKSSSAELSEAINSMYRWYAEASACYAYLADVPPAGTEDIFQQASKFRQSRWFTRGWTLQELIASPNVEFLASDWTYLGAKTGDMDFTKLLVDITGIQLEVLTGEMSPQDVSVAARMHWAADRQTSRIEDIAYCLLGIFDVNMPLLYGEGKRSFTRLQEAILAKEDDQSIFAWHSDSESTDATGGKSQLSQMNGLLADSPSRFWDKSDIETTMPLTLSGEPPTVTSRGLGVDFLLLPCPKIQMVDADFRVILNCERFRKGKRQSPVIYLKRIWGMGNQFARVGSDFKSFVPANISLLDGGFYERVFVKQNPAADIRTVRIMAVKDRSEPQLPTGIGQTAEWKIKDAWPKHGWTEATQTLQTQHLTFGLPCGIIRIEVPQNGYTLTIDVAIGMHAQNERLCRSWCQIMTVNPTFLPEGMFSWATHEAQSGNIQYKNLSTHNFDGIDVKPWVFVTERNRKKTLDIVVHVLSGSPSVGENKSRAREIYGQIIPVETLPQEERMSVPGAGSPDLLLDPVSVQRNQAWNSWSRGVVAMMEEISVIDTIETSVFSRLGFGSKVRIKAQHGDGVSHESLLKYCLSALPASDTETRKLVRVLRGENQDDLDNCFEASKTLESKPDSFLQLRPIQWAVLGGNLDVVRTLVIAGIDVRGKSDRRLTSLHLALILPDAEIFHYVCRRIEALSPPVPVSEASLSTFTEPGPAVEDWEPTVINLDRPAHFAASYATSPAFWAKHGLGVWDDIRRGNRLGERPIHRAAAMGNVNALEFILRNDESSMTGQCNITDDRGRTPLWHAACSDYSGSITAMLLSHGADPNFPCENGLAPIHIACRQGTAGCLKELISNGVSLALPTATNILPAHFAAIFGHQACLEVLLAHNAPMKSYLTDIPNVQQLSALHLAVANGKEECARSIWNSSSCNRDELKLREWKLCVLVEPSGPKIHWMYIEITDKHWFAVEQSKIDQGTRDFVLLSDEATLPAFWVRPALDSEHSQVV
ncbi:unnamed protein product [Clonostachys solani]|uniref:Heterokaryon incompatibility domain-containing protein n=1 Tax=Clonostachys solani TaxID=160281 RepID=A0A9P0END6_9HYPO|nr:unnamed protein product [Clonostachys solani]